MAAHRIGRTQQRHPGWDALTARMWGLVVAVVALYAFLVALGMFSPTDVIPVSALVAVLVALYARHAWLMR